LADRQRFGVRWIVIEFDAALADRQIPGKMRTEYQLDWLSPNDLSDEIMTTTKGRTRKGIWIRGMMKPTLAFLTALLLAPLAALQAGDAAKPKPNILLIYTDDHGWADLGAQGVDKDVRTPHLDRLAKDGVRFTRGYVSAPQCMLSRCGVITGRYQQRFGVEDNNHGPLPLSELTIAERLQPAGYLSGFVGKSHLDIAGNKKDKQAKGESFQILMDHLPPHQGFAEYFRGEMTRYYASHGLDGTPFADAPRLVRDDRFRVVVQTEAVLNSALALALFLLLITNSLVSV
jgi:hypothetical protein